MWNSHKIVLLFLAMLCELLASTVPADDNGHSTVLEKNHFYSNYEVNATYNITKVNKQKPIIFFLKKKDQNTIFTNNITITLISDEKSSECYLTSYNKMCYMDNLQTDKMKLKVKCDSLPCDVSWTILQPAVKKVQQKQQISDMFDISESNDHMIAMVTCNNPEVKEFTQKVLAYSQNQYIRGSTKNTIYFLFTKEQKGHIYFKIDPQVKSCAHMAIYNVPQVISQNKQLKDFALKDKTNVFKLENQPNDQFRIDAAIHEITKDPITSEIVIKIFGDKGGSQQTIFNASIGPGFGTTTYDFSFIVPKISADYSNVRIGFQSSNKPLFINFALKFGVAETERNEHAHFVGKTGDSIKFRLVSDEKAGETEKAQIIMPLDQSKVKLDKRQCFFRTGCEFSLSVFDNVSSLLYVGTSEQTAEEAIKQKEINFIEFTDKITHKIRQDDSIYCKKQIQKDKIFQVIVNNPNVILYAASKEKCAIPSEDCYEKIGNFHNPFIYAPQINSELLIVVEALDTCEFTLTTIAEGDAIILQENEPFAYLMDNYQSDLIFEFKNPQKQAISFNLIAPMHDLMLIVKQGKDNPDPDEDTKNLQGYISYNKKQLTDTQFRIMVKKTENAKDKFVHFTLIASTQQSNLRLDPGVPHYQNIKPKGFRDIVFEFDTQKDYLVNFFIQSLNKEQLKIPVLVSNQDKWTDKKVQHFSLSETSDTLNLKDVSEQLCEEEGQISCEIFIRVANQMNAEIDLTLTLMVKQSIIELKDGLWQSYTVNQIAQTAHFFFSPKNANKSISIHYRSEFADLGIVYSIWKSDQKNVNPTQWPFPEFKEQAENIMDEFKSVNQIMIDHQNLQHCWPSCLILVSLYKKKLILGDFYSPSYPPSFTIMASNQIIELPEKTKLDIYLKPQEIKYIIIDLKYALEKDEVVIFRNTILGYYTLTANVYSEKNQRCPDTYDEDFAFGAVQTIIKTDSIRQKMEDNDIGDDQNIYLCISATGIIESKFNLEYTTDNDEIHTLRYDTFQNVLLESNTPKTYQMEAWQEYEIKMTRQKGYFYFKTVVCDGQKQGGFEECRDTFLDDNDKGQKVVSKTQQFKSKPCQKCIVYIRFQTQEPSQLVLHIQSKYSTIQLKEKDSIVDFTEKDQQNKYTITTVQTEETVINVEVSEGDPIVSVTDYGQLKIQKSKNSTTNNIHIVIPPSRSPQEPKKQGLASLGGRNYDGFSYSSTFRYLGVRVKSKDSKSPCAYTITYSSGERETYLEDGLLTGYTLEPKIVSKFLYRPKKLDSTNHGFITISMNKSATLSNLDLKMYTFTDPNDEDTKVQVSPSKPPMPKKTPNPTIIFSLPMANLISIELTSKEEAKVTIMINHEELIILPLNQQFPFQLMKNQKLGLLTDINSPGYIMLTLRKCDQSEPTFGYTFDYTEFEGSEFLDSMQLRNEPRFQFYIKAHKIGTLYMQLNNSQLSDGLYTIKAIFSSIKIKNTQVRSGNNGIIQYSLMSSQKALINFKGVVCSPGKCSTPPKYYWIAGDTLQDVYTQTVCPSSFFLTTQVITVDPLKINLIQTNGNPEEIAFEYDLVDHISYVGVRAVSGQQQIYYRPIEVITLWGSINRNNKLKKMMMISVLTMCFVFVLVAYRRVKKNKKKKWGKVSDENDNDYDEFDQI